MEQYYKLPKELGGTVVKQVDVDGAGVYVEVPGMKYTIRIRKEDLTPAEPPAPPEPGLRAVVLDRAGVAWQHQATNWRSIGGINTTWDSLCGTYGPVKLMTEATNGLSIRATTWQSPEHAVWTGHTKPGDTVQVETAVPALSRDGDRVVRVRFKFVGVPMDVLTLDPETARDLAKALKQAAGPKS